MASETVSAKQVLKGTPLFAALDDAELSSLAARCVVRPFSAGEVLFSEGEPCKGLYIVVDGRVRIFKSSVSGREHVLAVEGPGASVAELPVFDGGNYPASASAMETTHALFVSRRAVTVFILTGLLFMLLPGTFLGVWNLISISDRRQLDSLSAAWIQAHGHAQIYGWIGTFILGIGFYSLSKMGELPQFAIRRAWLSYAMWTSGVVLRWATNVTGWQWRIALPGSALIRTGGIPRFLRDGLAP